MGDSFPWEDLLDFIEDGKVVPVIGHELIQADYQGQRVSLQRVLAERLADRLGDRETLTRGWTPNFELNDVVSTYLSQPGAKPVGLYDRVGGLLRTLSPPFPVPTALRQLAAIQSFDLFVTLTFDSLMARAIDQVRFAGNPVTREIEFSINQSTSAQTDALKIRPGEAPIVFSLFGRAGSKSDFAIHDEDALEFIHRLVSGDVTPPDWLLSELRSRHLLIVGVHMPEWLGRFVLRAATRDRLGVAQRAYFLAAENAPSDAALAQFMVRFGREARMSVFNDSAETFVAELHRRWQLRKGEEPSAAEKTEKVERGSIFISYGRENLAEVERLYEAIKKLGGDVWFDKAELGAGDYWEQKILPQIKRHVQIFVPVISDRTLQRSEGYVFREWREAIERSKSMVTSKRKFIVPTVVDADYTGNPQRYRALLDEFPAFEAANIVSAPGGEPDDALRKMLNEEIRALRRPEVA